MTSFGFGGADEEAFGGTPTSGVKGIEAGDGLAFFLGFLGSLLPELLLRTRKGIALSICRLMVAKEF
jgi:hypothetical protein